LKRQKKAGVTLTDCQKPVEGGNCFGDNFLRGLRGRRRDAGRNGENVSETRNLFQMAGTCDPWEIIERLVRYQGMGKGGGPLTQIKTIKVALVMAIGGVTRGIRGSRAK